MSNHDLFTDYDNKASLFKNRERLLEQYMKFRRTRFWRTARDFAVGLAMGGLLASLICPKF